MQLKINIKNQKNNKIRAIPTADIDELAQFQVNKNRRYTQLQAGLLVYYLPTLNILILQVNKWGESMWRLIAALVG